MTMETVLYRNRTNSDRIVEAIQYTRDNDREVFEWVPGKQRYGHDNRIEGMTVFTPKGRQHAVWGDWIYRDAETDNFWVAEPDAFEDSYEVVPQEAA